MISIIIPARQEKYLQKTIESILSAAEGEIEIIAILDGYWPEPSIQDDSRIMLIHHTEAIGQRPAINEAARIAKGKYILKTDAHSMFDQGFDVKLAADCEYDWTVIPRMYNLDVEKWKPKKHKITDFMFIRSPEAIKKPFRHYYFDGPCRRENPEEYKAHKLWASKQPEIADVMTGQGACWFIHRDRFWELGGMDEAHGQWGQMGIEIACKAWLSGGSLKVNRKTWFAHWFRGGSGPGFPWPASGREQEKARNYSRYLWLNGKWPLQKKPISWLVNKFAPVPTWNGKMEAKVIPATIPSIRSIKSVSFVRGRDLSVKELVENKLAYGRPEKLDGLRKQSEFFPPLVKRILKGETFTDKEIEKEPYYDYLITRLNPAVVNKDGSPTPKGKKHCISKIRDFIKLTYDLRDVGLKAPIDLYVYDKVQIINGEKRDKVIITRGSRRLAILYQLGVKTVPARVWCNEWLARHYIPTARWPSNDDSIDALASKQFIKYKGKSTDKYRVHSYTPYYDFHLSHIKPGGRPLAILELGVSRGMSLAIWADAFPRATVYGVDHKLKRHRGIRKDVIKGKNIKIFKGKQEDVEFLTKLSEDVGPFDFIVDDCSHIPSLQKISFETLWPYLKSNGVYVIEDLEFNYRTRYNQSSIMPFLKDKVESIYTDFQIKSVAFYPNIVFLTKA